MLKQGTIRIPQLAYFAQGNVDTTDAEQGTHYLDYFAGLSDRGVPRKLLFDEVRQRGESVGGSSVRIYVAHVHSQPSSSSSTSSNSCWSYRPESSPVFSMLARLSSASLSTPPSCALSVSSA